MRQLAGASTWCIGSVILLKNPSNEGDRNAPYRTWWGRVVLSGQNGLSVLLLLWMLFQPRFCSGSMKLRRNHFAYAGEFGL